ncbi:M56 family metallopeptidase [Parapedobacter koreensis]|nr:M56 family metallopeptidase [Parapedobacter koreensis]
MYISLDNIIEATGWSIIHSLWIGALVYGLLLLLFAAFPEANARIRYVMSFSSLLVLFAGFISVFFSLLEFSFRSGGDGTPELGFLAAFLLYSDVTVNPVVPIFRYLATGYVVGLCLQFALLGGGYLRLSRLRRVGLHTVPDDWNGIFAQMLLRMGVTKQVGFWLSAQVKAPVVIGYFKPLVLFPLALPNHLDGDQVEAILIHELSHIRRNDYLLNLFKTTMEALLFFNPFVWLLGRIISQEREHACDDKVLEQTGKPIFYAQTLLHVASLSGTGNHGLAMAATGRQQSQLFQRIKRITSMSNAYHNVRQQLIIVAVAALAAASLAWASPKKTGTDTVNRIIADGGERELSPLDTSATELSIRLAPPADSTDTTANRKIVIVTKRDTLSKRIQMVYRDSLVLFGDSLKLMNLKPQPGKIWFAGADSMMFELKAMPYLILDSIFDGKPLEIPKGYMGKFDDFFDLELYNSPEYKALRDKFEQDVKKLKEKQSKRK